MSDSTSFTSIIADLGFLSEQELGELQARQVIYGGDAETNLLELDAVTEARLLEALSKFCKLEAAQEGYLRIDRTLSQKARAVSPEVVVGVSGENPVPTIYTSRPLASDVQRQLGDTIGGAPIFRATLRLRISEALAAMGLGKVTLRDAGLLERMGARPAGASLDTAPPEFVADIEPEPTAPDSEAPTATLPEVEELPPKGSFPQSRTDHPTLEPAPARPSSLAKTGNPPAVAETGPPPQGYDELTAAAHNRFNEGRSGRAGPRLKYATPEAIAALSRAKSRDRVIDVLVHYAAQFFEYTAVFAVLSSSAKGLSATGSGTNTEALKKLRIPLDLPSAFQKAQRSTAPQVTRLKASGLEGGIARDLDRPTGREILLLPIGVRGRSVLLLWGDRGKHNVDFQGVSELLSFAPAVAQALERVLMEHKRASRLASPQGHGESLPPLAHSSLPPPRPVSAHSSAQLPAASPPTTKRNSAAPAAQPPNLEAGHEVAKAGKRTLSKHQAPSYHPAADSEPPMNFPAETPKTIPGFPQVGPPKDPRQGFSPKKEEPQGKPSLGPRLLSRRIVPLDSVVRIQSDPPLDPPDAPVEMQSVAPPPPPLDLGEFSDPPRHSDRGTLMSRRPPIFEPSEDGWEGAPSPDVVPRKPPGQRPAPRAQSTAELVRRLLDGDESAMSRLVEGGETSVAALIAEFPGPVTEPSSPTARASECGPILKALVALGSKSTPFLTVRTADEDADVRRWATYVLGELQGKEAAKAIAGRLLDDSADVRRAALASARRARSDVLTRRTLRSQMEELCRDTGLSSESRMSAVEALADIREHEAIPTLLQLLDDADASLVRATRWALSVLTRQDFGTSNEAWKKFWQENRDLDRVEWLISSLAHEQRDLRRAAGEELKALAGQDFGYNEDLPESDRRTAQAEFRRWWTTEGKARLASS